MPPKESKGPDQGIKLSEVPATVARVHFDGVRRTSRDLLKKQVRHLFTPHVSNFETMVEAAEVARERLKQLGVFQEVELLIDKAGGAGTYEVVFGVKEYKARHLSFSMLSSLDNRASLVSRGSLRNILGAAERLEIDWHVGMNRFSEQQRQMTFVKPLEDAPAVKFMAGLFDSAGDLSWVQMAERSRGAFVGVHCPTFAGSHSLRVEGLWRQLMPVGTVTLPMSLREESGHFLRCALRHDFKADGRDDPILPICGGLAKLRQELAMGGGGQDQAHLLHDLELQWNIPLYENPLTGACMSLQMSQSCGLIRPISANQHINVADRFFLGGPLSLRGFEMRSAGPRVDAGSYTGQSHFPHGGRAYSLTGLHLYSTLPFLNARGLLQNIRLHAFAGAGGVSTREPRWFEPVRIARLFADQTRLSFGLGIVVRLFGLARFEVNYCWPMMAHSSDKLHPGLQCGIGMEYQ